jgi:hypothetical protein
MVPAMSRGLMMSPVVHISPIRGGAWHETEVPMPFADVGFRR